MFNSCWIMQIIFSSSDQTPVWLKNRSTEVDKVPNGIRIWELIAWLIRVGWSRVNCSILLRWLCTLIRKRSSISESETSSHESERDGVTRSGILEFSSFCKSWLFLEVIATHYYFVSSYYYVIFYYYGRAPFQ